VFLRPSGFGFDLLAAACRASAKPPEAAPSIQRNFSRFYDNVIVMSRCASRALPLQSKTSVSTYWEDEMAKGSRKASVFSKRCSRIAGHRLYELSRR